MSQTIYKITVLLAASFFAFIIWVIYMANTGQDSVFFEFIKTIPYGDKIGHVLLFGVLTFFANLATKLRKIKIFRLLIPIGTLVVISFVLLEEISQHFIESRTFDLTDLFADVVGIVLFTLLSYQVKKHFL